MYIGLIIVENKEWEVVLTMVRKVWGAQPGVRPLGELENWEEL